MYTSRVVRPQRVKLRHTKTAVSSAVYSRHIATATAAPTGSIPLPTAPKQKREGTIEDIYSSFHTSPPFDARFADLKKEIWKEGMVESWRQVLRDLEKATGRVIEDGGQASSCFR